MADLNELSSAVDSDIPFVFQYDEGIYDKRPPTHPEEDEGQEPGTVGEIKEVEAELEAEGKIDATVESTTAQRVPDPGFAETTVDATLPNTDFSYEIPALIVRSILSSGKAYRWFSELPTEYQDAVVSFLLVYVAISMGYPLFAPAAPAAAPAIRITILESNEEDPDTDEG
jgi:hypothetical protein